MKKVILVVAAAVGMSIPASAEANGPCGQDFNGNTACGINSPASESGSLTTVNEADYYVFHAFRGTQLHVSITDTENPACNTTSTCGDARVQLTDAQGNGITSSDNSRPNNGITVPATLNQSLDSKGTYYLIVRGDMSTDNNGNGVPLPYTLNVTASPQVVWPAPPPYKVRRCTTKRKRVRRHHHWVRVRYQSCRTVTVYP